MERDKKQAKKLADPVFHVQQLCPHSGRAKWKIADLTRFYDRTCIREEFDLLGVKWVLEISPWGFHEKKDDVSTNIVLMVGCRKSMTVDITLTAVRGSETRILYTNRCAAFSTDNTLFGGDLFVAADRPTANYGPLTLYAHIRLLPTYIHGLKLGRETLSEMYDHKDYTDFELRCQGQSVRVHRAVLAHQSPFFKAAFKSPMVESKDRVMELADVTLPVLHEVIRWCYVYACDFGEGHRPREEHESKDRKASKDQKDSKKQDEKDEKDSKAPIIRAIDDDDFSKSASGAQDKTPLSTMIAVHRAAECYQIESLVEFCEKYIESQISTDTLIEILLFALDKKISSLQTKCMDFVKADDLTMYRLTQSAAYQKLDLLQLKLVIGCLYDAPANRPSTKRKATDDEDMSTFTKRHKGAVSL